MMRKSLFFLLAIALSISCSNNEFKPVNQEIKKKLITFGEGKTHVSNASHLGFSFAVQTMHSNEYERLSNSYFLSDFHPSIFGEQDLADCIGGLVQGDSLIFRLPYSAIKNDILDEFTNREFFIEDSVQLEVWFSCDLAMTNDEFMVYNSAKVREGLNEEIALIKEYVSAHNLEEKLTQKGDLYFMKTKETNGVEVKENSDVAISLTCSFLDGKSFSHIPEHEPLYINISAPDQVVQGVEAVLKVMREGETVRAIFPSYLAFGAKGSTDGTVPAHTPILADVSLIEVF